MFKILKETHEIAGMADEEPKITKAFEYQLDYLLDEEAQRTMTFDEYLTKVKGIPPDSEPTK